MGITIQPVSILGGGPAGATAAITARIEGSEVHLIEKSKLPRHKVCGEFLSPEITPLLEGLGVWDAFLAAGPARVNRMKLHFGKREKVSRLRESAWGLSRYAFDALLFDQAIALGAQLHREPIGDPQVIATGRHSSGSPPRKRDRLFGFKAHFEGPSDDAVELFFFDRCYVGLNAVEGGRTNVCGLGPEGFLRRNGFEYDQIVRQSPALAARLAPLQRCMNWLSTGPLQYQQAFDPGRSQYLAGDALSFVDPFTGSGLLAAVKTGTLAGKAAARREPVAAYLAACRASLRKPFEIATMLRAALDWGWADRFAGLIPGRILFALTRPE
ncbi:MAG: FAD-dependent monooxygenase [Bryobacteraceae bacterium]|jgi:flavin-dependent dehydrogenase